MGVQNDAQPISLPFPAILEALVLQLTDKQFKALQTGRGVPADSNRGNSWTPCHFGHVHQSSKEARYCDHLHYRERGGEIRSLKIHPRYNLIVNGKKVGVCTPDFEFWDVGAARKRIQDVKGSEATMSEACRLRFRLFEAIFGQTIEIITEVRW